MEVARLAARREWGPSEARYVDHEWLTDLRALHDEYERDEDRVQVSGKFCNWSEWTNWQSSVRCPVISVVRN